MTIVVVTVIVAVKHMGHPYVDVGNTGGGSRRDTNGNCDWRGEVVIGAAKAEGTVRNQRSTATPRSM